MNDIIDYNNPESIAKKLAVKLKRIRLSKQLTQEILAKRSGVSLGSLKRFETTHEISLKHLLQLALALDILDDFHQIFPENNYNSIDDIVNQKKSAERKRGRNE